MTGVGKTTLERWLAQGKVAMPKRIMVGARASRIWTDRDINSVKRYKEKFYRKGRGRKPKNKKA